MSRIESAQARLVRVGFLHPARAEKLLGDAALAAIDREWLLSRLAAVGDPDEGLLSFIRLQEAAQRAGHEASAQLAGVLGEERAARRLFAILGFSHPLTDQLIKDPAYVHILRDYKVGEHPFATSAQAEKAGALAAVQAHNHVIAVPSVGTAASTGAAGVGAGVGAVGSTIAVPNASLADVGTASGVGAAAGAAGSTIAAAGTGGLVGTDSVTQPVSALNECDGIAAMRAHYWYRIAQIAAADLVASNAPDILPAVSGAISDVVAGALEAALAVGRAVIPGAERVGLAVIAMGKAGGRELNYVSDVDVIFVARALDPALTEDETLAIATKLAEFLSKAVSKPGAARPPLWELDVNLRPEGKAGPLVRTLESHLAYYQQWAKGWEFQALLKARPIAGDMGLGERYVAVLRPLVWSAAGREHFVEDSRAMRRRVEDLVPAKEANRQLKLGKGGLRDVEFTVQLLQLVHGRTDASLQMRNTLAGLAALTAGGYVSRADGEKLAQDYRVLRALEHRIQMRRFQRSHVVPKNPAELRRIARALPGVGVSTADELEKMWQEVRHEVRELHLAIYYRPILPAVAKLSPATVLLDDAAAQARLAAIGYRDPAGALTHIKALTSGISRTAAIQRQLWPVMIEWFANGPRPDHGLKAFRVLSELMGHTSWYMRLLRDSSAVAERLAYVLSASRYLADELPKLPEAMSWLGDDELLIARTRQELAEELDSLLSRRNDPLEVALAGRYLRRKELLRAGLADVTLRPAIGISTAAISHAGDIAVVAALQAAQVQVFGSESGDDLLSFAVIGMGRFGGAELNYASDADVLFVYEPRPGKDPLAEDKAAQTLAKAMVSFIAQPAAEPAFPLDTKLRPEGQNGPLVRSLQSYREYYARWADTWERQALLRARFVAGDQRLAERFTAIIDPLRYPETGLSESEVRAIRAMKARIERERMPRAVTPVRHLKLGPGSLSDVEWAVQLLQLQHAGQCPQLRTPSTIAALRAAASAGYITSRDAEKLVAAWSFASRLRNMNVLATGRMNGAKVDVLPQEADEHAVVATLMGYERERISELDEDYLRTARRGREVVERIFFGLENAQ